MSFEARNGSTVLQSISFCTKLLDGRSRNSFTSLFFETPTSQSFPNEKTPPASFFLKKAVNIKSGSQTAGKETIAQISSMKIKEIAEAKMKDLNANTVEAAMKIIMGSARSMGIEVKD